MKTIFITMTFMFLLFPQSIYAEDYNRGKLPQIANPAWVYPSNRKYYKGYEKKKNKVQNNQDWKHHTNRDTGKNRGSGSLYYYDYRSVRERTSGKK